MISLFPQKLLLIIITVQYACADLFDYGYINKFVLQIVFYTLAESNKHNLLYTLHFVYVNHGIMDIYFNYLFVVYIKAK